MSPLVIERPNQVKGTSAESPMRVQKPYQYVGVSVFPPLPETANTEPNSHLDLLIVSARTSSGFVQPAPSADSTEVTRTALHELRKLSGLTWEQLARLFNASSRSLHFWASGEPLSRSNEESLNRLLGTIRYFNRGSASVNRNVLLSPGSDSKLPFDLLIEGRYEEVKQLLGPGNATQRPTHKPLSSEASASRMPQKPEELVGALHDPIHHEVGKSRAVRAVRSRKRDSD